MRRLPHAARKDVPLRSWVDVDHQGRQFLVREGRGRVSAVAPVSDDQFLVEILCELPPHWSASLRTTVQARIPAGHPSLADVRSAEVSGETVTWSMEWHRHEGIPVDIPLEALDLRADTHSTLVAFAAVDEAAPLLESTEAIDG